MLFSKDILSQAEKLKDSKYWNRGDGMLVRFKKDKVLCTFCLGDSTMAKAVSKVEDVQISCGYRYAKDSLKDACNIALKATHDTTVSKLEQVESACRYVELQYHGKLTPDCIESIFIPRQTLRQIGVNTVENMKRYRCIIYTTDINGELNSI